MGRCRRKMIGEYYALYLLLNPNKGAAFHKSETGLQTCYPALCRTTDLVMPLDLV